MNTLFEIILGDGGDLENDLAAAEAALDEIARIETVLSRFDPASEVARVNREAHQHPVLVSYELLEILEVCRDYCEKTFGHFDITAGSGVGQSAAELHSAESWTNPAHGRFEAGLKNPRFLPSATRQHFRDIIIDSAARKVSFAQPGLRLDFGAFGKGYALDRAAELLKENGVRNALLHGGTSSVLAIGNPAQVGLRNPWNAAEEIASVRLNNQGLSTSAVFHCGENESNIVHPLQRKPLCDDAACVVIAPTATEAEIFSTALLCMGKADAEKFVIENLSPDFRVLWAERSAGLQPAFTELSSKL